MNQILENQLRKHWNWLKEESVEEVIKFINAFNGELEILSFSLLPKEKKE